MMREELLQLCEAALNGDAHERRRAEAELERMTPADAQMLAATWQRQFGSPASLRLRSLPMLALAHLLIVVVLVLDALGRFGKLGMAIIMRATAIFADRRYTLPTVRMLLARLEVA